MHCLPLNTWHNKPSEVDVNFALIFQWTWGCNAFYTEDSARWTLAI